MNSSAQKLAEHAATNAACITAHLHSISVGVIRRHLNYDAITIAAMRLAEIETSAGWDWEEKRNDWETVCARIAEHREKTGKAPSPQLIRAFINRK